MTHYRVGRFEDRGLRAERLCAASRQQRRDAISKFVGRQT